MKTVSEKVGEWVCVMALVIIVSLICFSSCTSAFGAQAVINVGTTNNDGTGDSLRAAFQKVNANFGYLFTNAISISSSGSLAVLVNGSVVSLMATQANLVAGQYITLSPTNTGIGNISVGIRYTGPDVLVTSNFFYNLLYPMSSPAIASFTATSDLGAGPLELGQTVSSTILAWSLTGATVTTQHLSQSIGSIGAVLRSWTNVATYSSDHSYILTVGNGSSSASASAGVTFQSKRYWGSTNLESLTDAQILALSGGSELASSIATTKTFTPDFQYVYFAWPTSFGTPVFHDGNGFLVTSWTVVTRNFRNASGGEVNYSIYRSDEIQAGSLLFTVQ